MRLLDNDTLAVTPTHSGPSRFRSDPPGLNAFAFSSTLGTRSTTFHPGQSGDLTSSLGLCGSAVERVASRMSCQSKGSSHSHLLYDLIENGESHFTVLSAWCREDGPIRNHAQTWETVGGPMRRSHRGSTVVEALPESEMDWDEDTDVSCMVLPTSKKRVVWDIVSLFFVASDVIMVPTYFLNVPTSPFWIACGWISRIFWLFDVLASFLTGTYVNGSLELRPWKVARNYVRSWFLLDLLIIFAQWLPVFDERSGGPENWPLMVLLRGARVLRLLRMLSLVKVQMVLHEIGSRFSHTTLAIVGLVKFLAFSAILIHFLACSWYGIGGSRMDGWVHVHDLESGGIVRRYLTSLHSALAQLHGTSVIHPGNLQEYAFANMVMILGVILSSYLVSMLTNTMMQLDLMHSNDTRQQRLLCGYLKRHGISSALAVRVRAHFEAYCMQRHEDQLEVAETKAVLAVLPQSLLLDMDEETHGPVLLNYGFLTDVNEDNPRIVRQLCHEALTEVSAQTGEVIFTAGDVCTRMLFIVSGTAGYALLRRPMAASPVRRRSSGGTCESAYGSMNANIGGVMVHFHTSRSPSDANMSDIPLNAGDFVSEAVLWTAWEYCGELTAICDTTMLAMSTDSFAAVISRNAAAYFYAMRYARTFVKRLNHAAECSDVLRFHLVKSAVESEPLHCRTPAPEADSRTASKTIASMKRSMRRLDPIGTEINHYIFISHYKAEAGTEAALMQETMERMICEDPQSPGHCMKAPAFLDSEDLADLNNLKEHVRKSHNLILLLTNGVLERPWVLIEIVTASNAGLHIIPVEVQKKDISFEYPDEAYFEKLRNGNAITVDAASILLNEGITLVDLENTLRKVFKKIAVPFSPHKSANVRDAELRDILRRCQDPPDLS